MQEGSCHDRPGEDERFRSELLERHRSFIEQRFEEAVSSHGSFDLSGSDFARHVIEVAHRRAARCDPPAPLAEILDRTCYPDLYLAFGMASGSEAAWQRFEKELVPYVKGIVSGFTSDRSAVHDVTQDLLADLFFTDRARGRSRIMSYEGASSLRRWLMLVMRNRTVDALRRYRVEVPIDILPEPDEHVSAGAPLPEEQVQRSLDRHVLSQVVPAAFAELPAEDRLILKMRYVDGRKQRDIARLYGVDESRVSRWLTRIYRTVLRNALERLTEDHGLDRQGASELLAHLAADDLPEGLESALSPDASPTSPEELDQD